MNQFKQTTFLQALFLPLLFFSIVTHAETAFTYQGQLSRAGLPANGQYDMNFTLYDALNAGQSVGSVIEESDITVTDGVFDVLLDFGDAPFNNASRWLEIEVREAGGGNYTTLSPRQRVGASPFAIETLFVAPGAVDTAAIQDGAVTEGKIADEAITLGKIDNGAVVSVSIANGEVKTVDIDGGAVTRTKIADNAVSSGQIEDSSILPADIDGNVYNRKGNVYTNTQTTSVGFGINEIDVTCTGAKDLLINHVCNLPFDNSDITVLSERLTSVDNDVNPARLNCTAENRDPQNAETLTATVWCLVVD